MVKLGSFFTKFQNVVKNIYLLSFSSAGWVLVSFERWEVARMAQMYTKPKSVGPVDICFSCDGTPHIACHECKALHCSLHACILCQLEICFGLRQSRAANLAAAAVAFDICFSCDGTPHIACHECKALHCSLHACILCQLEICFGLRQSRAANLAVAAVAFALVAASNVDTYPCV